MARGRTGKPEPAADPGIGDFKAPRDSELWAQALRANLQKELHDLNHETNGLGDALDAMIETGAWQKLNKRDGSYFTSLEDLCTAREPYGFGLPMTKVRALLALTFRGKAFAAKIAPDVHPTARLPLASLRRDGGTQIRAGLTDATVAEYRTALDAGAAFPPVVVFFDGADHWLADGFHRVAAHEAAGLPDVLAEVRAGTKRDALLFAVGANGHHGLPRTNADKRRAVMVLLADEEWGSKSDRWIAERAAVDHKTVARLRAEASPVGEVPHLPETRTGKDGKSYPTKREPKPAPTPPAPLSPTPSLAAAVRNAPDRAELEAAYTRASGSARTTEEAEAIGQAYRDRIAELSQAPTPPPAPPSSGQVALELDAPATPEAPDAPEADDLVAQLHLLERELVGTTPAFRERARMTVAGLIADARRNRR